MFTATGGSVVGRHHRRAGRGSQDAYAWTRTDHAVVAAVCDDVAASEVVLVTMMPDDSGSIAAAGNARAVRDGHNLVLDALAASKQAGEIFVHTRYLNG